jgi:2-oxoisovalerate dehydrogenase E2 component (dihydrolipoyl transacylase)
VAEFDKICEVQSDKASVEITSRYAGTVTKLYHDVHGIAKVGQPLVDIEVEGDEDDLDINTDSNKPSSAQDTSEPVKLTDGSKALVFPSVRRLTVTNGIDLKNVQGTGKHGTVLKGNVIDYINGNPVQGKNDSLVGLYTLVTNFLFSRLIDQQTHHRHLHLRNHLFQRHQQQLPLKLIL